MPFTGISIRFRLMMLMICMTTLPVITVTWLATNNTRDSVEKEMIDANQSRMQWASQYLDELIQQLDTLFYSLHIQTELIDELSGVDALDAGERYPLQNRLFGIGVFRSWFVGLARKLKGGEPSKRTVVVLTTLAIVPPGLFWALGHVGYAVYPVYTRVIELVLLSFLFGWFMLRFGLMTVIFAHVTLDAILMGMQMMFDGLPGDFAGGVFSLIFPGLVGIVIWWLHGAIRPKT